MSSVDDRSSQAKEVTLNRIRWTLKLPLKNVKRGLGVDDPKTQSVSKSSTINAAKAGKTRVLTATFTVMPWHRKSQISPFLTAPQELRDQVYELVLGHHLIQILVEPEDSDPMRRRRKPRYYEDEHRHESIRFLMSTRGPASLQPEASHEDVLEDVLDRDSPDNHSARGSPDKPDLRLLRVCKQIYQEARLIPFKTNTFSISKGSIFKEFSRQLPDHFQCLRSLNLDIDLTRYEYAIEWTRIFNGEGLSSNHSSKGLHIHTLHLFLMLRYNMKQKMRRSIGHGADFWVTGFLQLQRRQLEHVTVEMDVYGAWEREPVNNELIDAEKQSCCDRLRERLLEPPRGGRDGATDSGGLRIGNGSC